jgi:LPXTG-site transpeptidase (sortase) family protein
VEFARRTVAGVGRTLITVGVLLLLFVSYQLWGTGLRYAGAQERQDKEFAKTLGSELPTVRNIEELPLGPFGGTSAPGSLALDPPATTVAATGETITFGNPGGLVVDTTVPTTTSAAPTTAPATTVPATAKVSGTTKVSATTTLAPPTTLAATTTVKPTPTTKPVPTVPKPPATTRPFVSAKDAAKIAGRGARQRPKKGEVVAQILIPKLGLSDTVIEGTEVQDLKKGPGHYRGTPMPGNPGNASIAGHRTTYGAPFLTLDELKPGDPIYVVTEQGRFRYKVREQEDGTGHLIVNPKDNSVLADAPGENRLTLTTCNPRYSARERLIVIADLDGEAAEAEVFLPEPEPVPVGASLAAEPEEDPSTIAPSTAAPTTAATTTSTTTTIPETTTAPVDSLSPSTVATSTTSTTLIPATTTVAPTTPTTVIPTTVIPTTTVPETRLSNDAHRGSTFGFWWFRGPGSTWRTTMMWALLCGVIWLAAWFIARGRRFARQAMVYAPVFLFIFLPALYFCYESLARLLPENV